jgi:hypothetical protein
VVSEPKVGKPGKTSPGHMVTGEPVTGEIVRFSPTSEIDGGGAQHKGAGQSSPIRLVF